MLKYPRCYDLDILCCRIGARGTLRVRVSDRSPRAAAFPSPHHAVGDADACIRPHPLANTVWNEAYIMLMSCIDYALDMTCIQSVSQRFIVGGIL